MAFTERKTMKQLRGEWAALPEEEKRKRVTMTRVGFTRGR